MRNYQANTDSKLEIMPSKPEAPTTQNVQESSSLIDSLKFLNIELLDDREKEKLRFLSLQFQFHLKRYQERELQTSKKKGLTEPSNCTTTNSLSKLHPQPNLLTSNTNKQSTEAS